MDFWLGRVLIVRDRSWNNNRSRRVETSSLEKGLAVGECCSLTQSARSWGCPETVSASQLPIFVYRWEYVECDTRNRQLLSTGGKTQATQYFVETSRSVYDYSGIDDMSALMNRIVLPFHLASFLSVRQTVYSNRAISKSKTSPISQVPVKSKWAHILRVTKCSISSVLVNSPLALDRTTLALVHPDPLGN